MTRIVLSGNVDPATALSLRARLERETDVARPQVEVDLSRVVTLHAAAANALIRGQRRARRAAGTLRVIPPTAEAAARTLHHIGLVESGA